MPPETIWSRFSAAIESFESSWSQYAAFGRRYRPTPEQLTLMRARANTFEADWRRLKALHRTLNQSVLRYDLKPPEAA